MTKKFQIVFDVEIEDGAKLRRAWKSEGYANLDDFLFDYLYDISDDLLEFSDYDFEIKKFKFIKTMGKENGKDK